MERIVRINQAQTQPVGVFHIRFDLKVDIPEHQAINFRLQRLAFAKTISITNGGAFFIGTVAWFVLDSLMSLALGAVVNVVGNMFFLGLLLPPLAVLSSRRG